jgi:hypothetical protein
MMIAHKNMLAFIWNYEVGSLSSCVSSVSSDSTGNDLINSKTMIGNAKPPTTQKVGQEMQSFMQHMITPKRPARATMKVPFPTPNQSPS